MFDVEHEEYLEAVDLTSYVGTIPTGLPLTSLRDLPPLFVDFQVNNGVLYVLDYVEDIYIRVLSFLVSILNPSYMYLPLLLTVLYKSSSCHKSNMFVFVLNTFYDYGIVVLCCTVHYKTTYTIQS